MSNSSSPKYRNLPESVADYIVEHVAKGDLRPGERLYEKDIAEALGISQMPVREALRLLQAQGVVHALPNRGTFITEFGSAETEELVELRLAVERIALRRLMQRMDDEPQVVLELDKCLDSMREAAKTGDSLIFCRAALSFHTRLIELAGSPMLRPLWDSLSRGVLVFMMQEYQERIDFTVSIDDHEVLLNAVRSGRHAAADREIDRHLTSYVDRRTQRLATANAADS